MAKGRRDVELVVRARNEASKAVDAITSALDSMTKAQASAAKGAKDTKTALSQFGTIMEGLAAKSKGASVFQQIASSSKSAADAVDALGDSASKTRDEQVRLGIEITKAEGELAKYTATAERAATAQTKATEASKTAKAAQAQLTAERRKAEGELRRAIAAEEKAPEAYDRQVIAARKAEQALDKHVAAIAADGVATEKQAAKLDRLTAANTKQQTKLEELTTALNSSAGVTEAARAKLNGYEQALVGAAAEIERTAAAEKEAAQATSVATQQAKAAATALSTLQSEEARVATTLGNMTSSLKTANAELEHVKAATTSADAALGKVGTTVRGTLLSALKDGTAQLANYKAEWDAAQRAAGVQGRLRNVQIARGDSPESIAETSAAQRAAVQAAGQAKQAYLAQQQALQVLRTSIREAGTDVQALNALFNADTASAQRFRGALQTLQTTATMTAPATRQVGSAARETAQALDEASNEAGAYEQSLKRMGASGRETLSMWSRIKGEVIALTLSYVGLYGAMAQLRGAVDTFNKVQGAMNQLKLATGTTEEAGKQFEWLRGEANRLGFSYVELTKEYSKFLVSVQNSPQLKPQAQQIFTSFMEAGRVLNLTSDQITGVMNALVQMVGKGAVSMEELRQQMADQGLLGVFNMLADAMHLTTDELSKMISTGNLASSEAIPKLAQQMSKVFGPGVLDASKSLAAEMARFENTVSDAQLAFANGGFADALASSLKDLNEYFASEDGKKFFAELGAAAGIAVKALAIVPKNMDLIVIALSAMVGIKATAFITDLNLRFKDYMVTSGTAARATQATTAAMTANAAGAGSLRTILTALRVSMVGVQTSTTAAGVATAGTATKFTLMRAAVVATTGAVSLLRAGLAALGGPVGIAITAITYAISAWATSTDDATAALDRHSTVLDEIRKQYQAAKGDVKAWSDEVKKQSLVELQADQNRLQESLKNARSNATLGFGSAVGQVIGQFGASDTDLKLDKQLGDAMVAFREGTTSAKEFRDELTRIAAASPKMVKYVDQLLPNVDDAVKAEESLQQIAAAMKVVNGTATDAEKTLAGFKDAADDLGAAVPPSEALEKALESAEEKFGATDAASRKLAKTLKSIKDFRGLFDKMNPDIDKTSAKYRELIALLDHAEKAAKEDFINSTVSSSLVDKIIGVESGNNAAAKNPNSSATGLGQFIESTWLDLFKKYFPDQAAGMTDATILELRKNSELSRKMVEAYAAENAKVLQDAGVAVNDAAVYLAHFLGPAGALKILKAADSTPVSQLLGSDQINANKSILGGGQTAGGLKVWAQRKVGISDGQVDLAKTLAKIEADRAQKQDEFNTSLKDAADLKEKDAAAAEKEAAAEAKAKDQFRILTDDEKESLIQDQLKVDLKEAQNAAAKKGVEFTKEDAANVERATRAEFAKAHAKDANIAKARQEEELSKNVSALESQRSSLIDAINLAQQQGDGGAMENLKKQLVEVNALLAAAIQKQIAYWQAVASDPESTEAMKANALAQIKQGETKIAQAQQIGQITKSYLPTAEEINNMIATGLGSTAVDNFIAKLQEGQSAMSALGDTMRQFFADFLLQIGKAILQQAILNAMTGLGVGKGISSFFGMIGLHHSGGVAGETTNRSRAVSPMWFANAARYHGGGVAGLKPGEVPAILEEGERIRTVDQERALQERLRSGGDGSASPLNVKVVNAIDAGGFLSAGMSTVAGERAIMNFMTNRKGAVKRALGI